MNERSFIVKWGGFPSTEVEAIILPRKHAGLETTSASKRDTPLMNARLLLGICHPAAAETLRDPTFALWITRVFLE